jgi:cardiolipin synthase
MPDWTLITGIAIALFDAAVAVHALTHKRDPRAALGWSAFCIFVPVAGGIAYLIFGMNRVQNRARQERRRPLREPSAPAISQDTVVKGPMAPLERLSNALQPWPVVTGNRVEMLFGGEQAFPAMLKAIDDARERVFLSTYIFDAVHSGEAFIDALARAHGRGADVRVLIDGIGEKYSWPRARRRLSKSGIPVRLFGPPTLLPPSLHINLRNHRKILAVDGCVAFAGGMNIGDRQLLRQSNGKPGSRDLHFRFDGPVAAQLETVFANDWYEVTGAAPPPPSAAPDPWPDGAPCRTLTDGPDHDLDKLTHVLTGAVGQARRQVAIMTPYFLPPRELVGALISAALRGVSVDVVLPGENNLPFVHWASRNGFWELLQRGVRIWYQPPPFDHSKILVVDDDYALVGSANLDPRSLRLNFELAVEIYGGDVIAEARQHVDNALSDSRPVTFEEIHRRSLPVHLRDAIAWLFSPYL